MVTNEVNKDCIFMYLWTGHMEQHFVSGRVLAHVCLMFDTQRTPLLKP